MPFGENGVSRVATATETQSANCLLPLQVIFEPQMPRAFRQSDPPGSSTLMSSQSLSGVHCLRCNDPNGPACSDTCIGCILVAVRSYG